MQLVPDRSDFLGIGITYGMVLSCLVVSYVLGKLGCPAELSRKLLHIVSGMTFWTCITVFRNPAWYAVAPTFLLIPTLLSFKNKGFGSGSRKGTEETLGVAFFPVGFITLAALAQYRPDWAPFCVLAEMPLTWGDALAAIVGQAVGKHPYSVGSAKKSLEGSVAMFVCSAVALFVSWEVAATNLHLLSSPRPWVILAVAAQATLVEALCANGTDNLALPFTSFTALLLLHSSSDELCFTATAVALSAFGLLYWQSRKSKKSTSKPQSPKKKKASS